MPEIKSAIDRANLAFCKKYNMVGTYHNDFTPFFAKQLIREVCDHIATYTDVPVAVANVRCKYDVDLMKRGDRVRIDLMAGYHAGAHGTVEFVEPSYTRIWVLRDGASAPTQYSPSDLEFE